MRVRAGMGMLFLVAALLACALVPVRGTAVLMDTDCGYDDATALAMLLQARVHIVGITTVQGDADCTPGTANIGRVLGLVKRPDVPLAKGATAPSAGGNLFPWDIRRLSNTLQGLPLPEGPPVVTPGDEDAAHFMVRMAQEHAGELVVMAVGPLTNVLHAIELGGDAFVKNVRELVVMGGALHVPGNAPNGKGELNMFADPGAAHRVFAAFGDKLTLSTADLSSAAVINSGMMKAVCAPTPTNPAGVLICECLAIMGTWSPSVLFDPLAAAHVLAPSLTTTVPTHVAVDTHTGQTEARADGTRIGVLGDLHYTQLVELLAELAQRK